MRRRILIMLLVVAAMLAAGRIAVVLADMPGRLTAARMAAVRDDGPRLRAFLHRMPKGGDLHTHLSGAVYAERFIAVAARDGLCLDRGAMVLVAPPAGAAADRPCGDDPGMVQVAQALAGPGGQAIHDAMVNAFSLRWFLPTPAVPSGHDQFFGSFSRFNAATGGADWDSTAAAIAEMTADQLRLYAADHVHHAEFMVTLLEGEDRRRLAAAIGEAREPAAMLAALKANGLDALVAARAGQMADIVDRVRGLLGCDRDAAAPGCGVSFRYIAQVNRNGAPAEVFAQTAHAAALVRAAPERVAGLNYVGPEDFRVARRDYRMHMGWIGFLAGLDVPVALHAGELWLGLVPPDDLDFHIRAAVEIAGARRIGHGTAVGFERDMDGLLQEMRARGVAVEIALTSSDVILGVRGRAHPIATYLAAGVPVVLATDDAGVSRIDLSNEYVRAARDHRLPYARLKAMSFAALDHAFLSETARARETARLGAAIDVFEQETLAALPLRDRLRAFARALVGAW